MTNSEIEHVKGCKALMQESAAKANFTITLEEYNTGDKNHIHCIDINLRDKDGYLIHKSYGDVGQILGFIRGYMYQH